MCQEICPCGKISYRNWEHANADLTWVVKKSHGKQGRVSVYWCRQSSRFHIGHGSKDYEKSFQKRNKKNVHPGRRIIDHDLPSQCYADSSESMV